MKNAAAFMGLLVIVMYASINLPVQKDGWEI